MRNLSPKGERSERNPGDHLPSESRAREAGDRTCYVQLAALGAAESLE